MSNAATEAQLWEIWRGLLDILIEAVCDAPRCPTCERGEITPAMLKVARDFLRDNNVTINMMEQADIRRSLESLRGLSLPFPTKQEKKE